MKTITIKGGFANPENSYAKLDVYTSNSSPKPYNISKEFRDDFTETLTDLEPGLDYFIDLTGFSTGSFSYSISGDFEQPNPLSEDIQSGTFSRGHLITTKTP